MKTSTRSDSVLSNPYFWIVTISILTFVFYFPSLSGMFTNWDDTVYVKENPYLKAFTGENLKAIFTTNYMGNYHPLAMLSLSIDYYIFGMNPFGFHFTNLILHIINALLVMFVIRKLTGNLMIGAFAGLIFGVHAFHVESVTWISERKDVLYTVFYLLSVLFYIKFIKENSVKWYIVSLVLFILSCLSKGQAVTLALTIVLVDIFTGRNWLSMRSLLEKAPYFLIAMVFGIVAIHAQEGADATIMANFPLNQRIAFASYGLIMYLLKLVLPFSLSAYYPYPINSDAGTVPMIYWMLIIPAVAVVAGWLFTYKKSKALFFGAGFFLLNIATLLQLLPVGRAIMADRYVYIPSIGYCFLIGWYLNDRKLINSRNTALIIILTYTLFLGFLTFQRTRVWKDSMTLWTDVVEKDNRVPLAWYNRGNIRLDSGNYQAAIADYDEGIKVDAKYWRAYINRGTAKNGLKNYIGAIEDFSKVINENPESFTAFVNRAHSYRMVEDYNNSLKDYNTALGMKPNQKELYLSRSNLRVDMKDYKGAIADLDEVLAKNPDYVSAYANRAVIRKTINDFKGSIEDYNKAIELDPGNKDYLTNRGNIKFQTGDNDGAMKDYSASISLDPNNFLAYKNRGSVYFAKGQYDEALADFLAATKLNSSSGEIFYNSALARQKKQDPAGVLADYKKAVELDPIYATDEFRKKLGIDASEVSGFKPSQFVVRGKAMEGSGNLKEAEALYKKAIELQPENAEAWFNLGNVYGKSGRFNEAMNCLNNAIRFKNNYAEALSSRGIAFASTGKLNEALKDLSASIKADPKFAAAYFNRAIVFLNSGKKDLACPDLQKAIELGYTAAYPIFQKECQKK